MDLLCSVKVSAAYIFFHGISGNNTATCAKRELR